MPRGLHPLGGCAAADEGQPLRAGCECDGRRHARRRGGLVLGLRVRDCQLDALVRWVRWVSVLAPLHLCCHSLHP